MLSTNGAQINANAAPATIDGFVMRPGDYGGRFLQFNVLRDFRSALVVQVRGLGGLARTAALCADSGTALPGVCAHAHCARRPPDGNGRRAR